MNRRKLLSLLGMSPALLASSHSETRKKEKGRTQGSASKGKIETLNPKGTPPLVHLVPMAPRLDSLDGKTVYLVDVGFMEGGVFLGIIKEWFARNLPSVTTVLKAKAGSYGEDDPKLWAEIKDKGHAMIMAIGH